MRRGNVLKIDVKTQNSVGIQHFNSISCMLYNAYKKITSTKN